jgi:hypothetical protein
MIADGVFPSNKDQGYILPYGDLSETFGRLQMQFRCGTESLLFDGHAAFGDDQRPALLRIQQGSSVNIEGRLSDHGRLLGLSLQDAEIRP